MTAVATAGRLATAQAGVIPRGPRPRHLTVGRVGLYAFFIVVAAYFLLPLYIMIVTSLKTMDEIRLGSIFAWPADLTFDAWVGAWSTACTGLDCSGVFHF